MLFAFKKNDNDASLPFTDANTIRQVRVNIARVIVVALHSATVRQHVCMGDVTEHAILPRFLMVPGQNKPNTLKLNSVARQASRYSARDPRLRT